MYKREEILTIENATCGALHFIELAQNVLSEFDKMYTSTTSNEELMFMISHYPDTIRHTISTISWLLLLAQGELDVFFGGKSAAVQRRLANAEEIRKIIAIYNNDCSDGRSEVKNNA